jgi:hypothetical protein
MLINPWVVAHEIGHLIGCRHGGGVMRTEYTTGEKRLWIDDDALHFAVLVRAKASSRRSSLALVAKGQPADFRAADQR